MSETPKTPKIPVKSTSPRFGHISSFHSKTKCVSKRLTQLDIRHTFIIYFVMFFLFMKYSNRVLCFTCDTLSHHQIEKPAAVCHVTCRTQIDSRRMKSYFSNLKTALKKAPQFPKGISPFTAKFPIWQIDVPVSAERRKAS